jgi:hypothetical protein
MGLEQAVKGLPSRLHSKEATSTSWEVNENTAAVFRVQGAGAEDDSIEVSGGRVSVTRITRLDVSARVVMLSR